MNNKGQRARSIAYKIWENGGINNPNIELMYINDYVSIQTFVVDGTITNPNGLSAYFYVGGADTPEPDGENWKACNISENTTKTSDTSKKYLCSTWFFFYGGTTFANYKVKIQVEKGTQTSSYTPYEGNTYTANADGKIEGIKSLSPYMTFVCNETDISVDYHKSWGMQTEYDKLWDTFQNNGGEVNYYVAFGYRKFTDKNYLLYKQNINKGEIHIYARNLISYGDSSGSLEEINAGRNYYDKTVSSLNELKDAKKDIDRLLLASNEPDVAFIFYADF